jgi:hypothetical protein
MKTTNFIFQGVLLGIILLISGCENTENEVKGQVEIDSLLYGKTFVFLGAKLESITESNALVEKNSFLLLGTDITHSIYKGLFSKSCPCPNEDITTFQLNRNDSIYVGCGRGQVPGYPGIYDPIWAGSWKIIDDTLIMNFNNTTNIFTPPGGLSLKITNIDSIEEDYHYFSIVGSASISLPKVLVEDIIDPLNLEMNPSAPDFIKIKFAILFRKVAWYDVGQ